MEYRQHKQPGCGGCLLILLLILLVTGGWSAVGDFLSMLFFGGFMFILLVFGAFFGFSWYVRRKVATYEASQSETHNRFVYLLIHILVKIAQSDGHFTKLELATMTNFFQYSLNYNQDKMYWVKQLIKDARNAEVSMDELLEEFKSSFRYEPRLILLELVYQIIYTKKPVNRDEVQQAHQIAAFLQISAYDLRTIEAKYMYGSGQHRAGTAESEELYYAELGLEKGADFAAIKLAYRKLSMQYHPDKVAHLGEEFKKVAEEKMKEINAAYDYFKKKNKQ